MNTTMDDSANNRKKLALFIAAEVYKDGRIPHFTFEAVQEIVERAREMSNKPNQLTVQLRELGGLVRAAGDLAVLEGHPFVNKKHVLEARQHALSIEEQIT